MVQRGGPAQLARPGCSLLQVHSDRKSHSLSSQCTRTPARKFAHFGRWHTRHACRPHARLQYITCLHRAPAAPRGSRLKKLLPPPRPQLPWPYPTIHIWVPSGMAWRFRELLYSAFTPHGGHGWVATVVRSCGVAGSSRLNRWRASSSVAAAGAALAAAAFTPGRRPRARRRTARLGGRPRARRARRRATRRPCSTCP